MSSPVFQEIADKAIMKSSCTRLSGPDPKIPLPVPDWQPTAPTLRPQQTPGKAITFKRRSRSPEVYDLLTMTPQNNRCFEGNNNCKQTVADYATSIGMGPMRPLPVRAKWRNHPYDKWKHIVVPEGQYVDCRVCFLSNPPC